MAPRKNRISSTITKLRKALVKPVTRQNISSCLVLPPEIVMHDAFNETSADICVVVHDDLGWKNRTRCNRFWRGPSKSYLTPPRWRGLGNGSTPVSHHITTRLRRVDENVDPAKLAGCARLSLNWGLGCPIGVGWVGPGLEGRPCWSPGSCTG